MAGRNDGVRRNIIGGNGLWRISIQWLISRRSGSAIGVIWLVHIGGGV